MTKSGLIEKVAERTPHISKKDTEVVVNTIFDAMTDALRRAVRANSAIASAGRSFRSNSSETITASISSAERSASSHRRKPSTKM